MGTQTQCPGEHRYFVADTAASDANGTVSVVVVCTSCGDAFCRTFDVASPGSKIILKEKTHVL
jgi:translation elongation factor EF-1alpha